MEVRLAEPAPTEGRDFASLLARLDADVLPFVGHFDHPRFLGYSPGAGTWPAALGDLIAAATNIDSGAWRESAGPAGHRRGRNGRRIGRSGTRRDPGRCRHRLAGLL